METKRFTVVDTRTNQVKTFNSEATTVGELKRDLMNIGIDPTGMAIQEGLTKTELGADDTELPKDITYRGVVTNNLVFRLTQPDKKIKSGMGDACCSRAEVYDKIKDLSLAEIIKAKYGKNYTTVKTSDLVKEVTLAMNDLSKGKAEPCVKDAIATLTSILEKKGVISADEANHVVEPILGVKIFADCNEECGMASEVVPFDYDIDEMFSDM